jgi:hypothetical protein
MQTLETMKQLAVITMVISTCLGISFAPNRAHAGVDIFQEYKFVDRMDALAQELISTEAELNKLIEAGKSDEIHARIVPHLAKSFTSFERLIRQNFETLQRWREILFAEAASRPRGIKSTLKHYEYFAWTLGPNLRVYFGLLDRFASSPNLEVQEMAKAKIYEISQTSSTIAKNLNFEKESMSELAKHPAFSKVYFNIPRGPVGFAAFGLTTAISVYAGIHPEALGFTSAHSAAYIGVVALSHVAAATFVVKNFFDGIGGSYEWEISVPFKYTPRGIGLAANMFSDLEKDIIEISAPVAGPHACDAILSK